MYSASAEPGASAVTLLILIKGLLLITSLVLLALLLQELEPDHMLSEAWIDSQIRGQGVRGELVFLAMTAVTTALGFPRQLLAFLGGYAFGFALGSVLALSGTLAGSLLAFFYARLLGRSLVQHRFYARVRKLDDFLSGHPFGMALIIRLLPVGNNMVTNLVAGVSSVAALPFLAGSGLGYLPQTLVFALAGSGVHFAPGLRLTLAVLLFLFSSLLGVWLYRRHRQAGILALETDGDEQRSR